jgi:hypothetical protein
MVAINLPASKLITLVFLLVETAIIATLFTFPSHALELTAALILLAPLALVLMVVLRASPESERMRRQLQTPQSSQARSACLSWTLSRSLCPPRDEEVHNEVSPGNSGGDDTSFPRILVSRNCDRPGGGATGASLRGQRSP